MKGSWRSARGRAARVVQIARRAWDSRAVARGSGAVARDDDVKDDASAKRSPPRCLDACAKTCASTVPAWSTVESTTRSLSATVAPSVYCAVAFGYCEPPSQQRWLRANLRAAGRRTAAGVSRKDVLCGRLDHKLDKLWASPTTSSTTRP